MCIEEISAEQLAEVFHHYYEALAPDFNCRNNARSESWSEVPPNERSRMIAAARLALLDVGSARHATNERERYFAKPGEAEWGC
jgi:hypothetical protein